MKLATRRHRASNRSGMALLWSVFVLFVAGSAAFVSYVLSNSLHQVSELKSSRALAESLSLAACEQAVVEIQAALESNAEVPADGSLAVTIDGADVTFTVEADGGEVLGVDPETDLDASYFHYRVRGSATVGGVTRSTRRVVRASYISAFQFAVFSEDDLVFYQDTTTIAGPVHTNGDMYIFMSKPLTFDSNYVRTAGDLTFGPKYASWNRSHSRDPDVRRWVADPTDPSEIEEYVSLEYDSSFTGLDYNNDGDYDDTGEVPPFAPYVEELTSEPFGSGTEHTFRTAEHGVGRLELPSLDDLGMFEESADGDYVWDGSQGRYVSAPSGTGTHRKGDYHQAADLTILTFEDGTWEAYNKDGTDVSSDLTSALQSSSIYDTHQAVDAGNTNDLQCLIIDVDQLGSSGVFPDNGLLYVAGYGAGTGTDVKAFQLTNGSELHGDFSVASPNSIFLHGDYNTVQKKRAAVIADSVSVLSNSWDGSKGPLTLPKASDTTFNVSIATGGLPHLDQSGGYFVTGNLLRRHENWAGKDEYFNGSLVALGMSQYATGLLNSWWGWWIWGYRPPDRNWSYDQDLNSSNNQPPFAPTIIKTQDVVTW